MTLPQQDKFIMTEAQYLAFDADNDFRSEFSNGHVIVMAGASYRHNVINMNVSGALHNQLLTGDCRVLQESLRVAIQKKNKTDYRYPDVVIVCGTPKFLKDASPDTLTNPVVLVEILSPSTASVDTLQKVEEYYQIRTVQDYLIVAQDRPFVIHYQRSTQPGLKWGYTDYQEPDKNIDLKAIGCTLKLDDIYRRVEFDPATEASE